MGVWRLGPATNEQAYSKTVVWFLNDVKYSVRPSESLKIGFEFDSTVLIRFESDGPHRQGHTIITMQIIGNSPIGLLSSPRVGYLYCEDCNIELLHSFPFHSLPLAIFSVLTHSTCRRADVMYGLRSLCTVPCSDRQQAITQAIVIVEHSLVRL